MKKKHGKKERKQKEKEEKRREKKRKEEEEEEQWRNVSRGRGLKSKTRIPQTTNVYDPCTAEVNQRESN